jgi:hypothetical protein
MVEALAATSVAKSKNFIILVFAPEGRGCEWSARAGCVLFAQAQVGGGLPRCCSLGVLWFWREKWRRLSFGLGASGGRRKKTDGRGRREGAKKCRCVLLRSPFGPSNQAFVLGFSARTKGLVTFKMSLKCCFCSSFEREVWERPTGVGARFFFFRERVSSSLLSLGRTGWVYLLGFR